MSKRRHDDDDDMLPEYDFSKGVRGKYVGRFPELRGLVKLDDDVARVFKDSREVNEALRALARILERHGRRARK